MISKAVKDFIEEHSDLIQENHWERFYNLARRILYSHEIGELSQCLLEADIDPLLYLKEVPGLYLARSDVRTVIIPDNIETICTYAFLGCKYLDKIKMSRSL